MLNLLLPHPAALIKAEKTKTLLIADPHIGWEIALQKKGIHVPSQTPKSAATVGSTYNKRSVELVNGLI